MTSMAQARIRKAAKLLVECIGEGINAGTAGRLDQEGRDALAGLAGVNPPSEETWRLVVDGLQALADREERVQ